MVTYFSHVALAVTILFPVLGLWALIQRWARKADHLPPDSDMLDRPEKKCSHCGMHGTCGAVSAAKPDDAKTLY